MPSSVETNSADVADPAPPAGWPYTARYAAPLTRTSETPESIPGIDPGNVRVVHVVLPSCAVCTVSGQPGKQGVLTRMTLLSSVSNATAPPGSRCHVAPPSRVMNNAVEENA